MKFITGLKNLEFLSYFKNFSEDFENWLQKNSDLKKETRFFRCDFIDEMTFDLKSKRHLKFASFLDEIGKKEEKEKFLKELQNKVFLFLY